MDQRGCASCKTNFVSLESRMTIPGMHTTCFPYRCHVYRWTTFLLILLCVGEIAAQSGPIGTPTIRNYDPEEFHAHNQNWSVVQDRRGIMYFANTEGILEYDGVTWRLITTKHNTIMRSLALGSDGRIYAGSFGEIGYLAPDTNQQMQFVSLLPFLKEEQRDFADVWQTLSAKDGIYFVTQKYIFLWDGKQMRTWSAKTSFHVGFAINGQFYVRQQKTGLMHMVGDSLVMAPRGERFADERIMAMFPFPEGGEHQLLLATRSNGLQLYDGITIKPFINEADAMLKEAQVYCGARLPGGQFAFGTLQNGVFVIDASGRMLHHLNKASGLQDETIWYLYPDRQGGLWIGMHYGISRVETASPFTYYGEKEGLEGSVLEITRHQGRIYAASSMGIYFFDDTPTSSHLPGRFKRVEGVSPQCWAVLPFGDVVLAAAFDGVYEIRGEKGRMINGTYAMSLCRSHQDSNRVYVGLQKGIKSLYYKGGKWVDEGMITPVDQEIMHIYETDEGRLWITEHYSGLGLLDFSKGFSTQPPYTRFDTLHGLPVTERPFAFSTIKGTRFGTEHGIYRFDDTARQFSRDTTLISHMGDSDVYLFSINEDQYHNLWIVKPGVMGVALRQADETYLWQSDPFLRSADINDYYAYPDPSNDHLTWIGCIDRVLRYDGNIVQVYDTACHTLIRNVTSYGDSILYGGAAESHAGLITLRHGYKSLRIRFAAPSFDDEAKTEYQYILEGYDAGWSTWSREAYKDYTGLPAGTYRFLVRAKNIYQQPGPSAVLEFEIKPPFYLSWWAYLVYAIILASGVYGLWRVNLSRLQKRHAFELRQLEYEKLKELDQLKSNFFANISHEFRTPLTLILGPVENLLSEHPTPAQASQYSVIKRNAQRLLQLINQLLDLSKLEAGKMKLNQAYGEITTLIKGVVHSFESMAKSKQINLQFASDVESAYVYFDRDKFEQILINLVANALKFTPDGGHVAIKVKTNEKEERLQIEIADTGPGISADQLPFIFDRFYQGAGHTHKGEPGTGIGLALTRELVELHKGQIRVHSILDQGTTFTVEIPYRKEALKDEPVSFQSVGKPLYQQVEVTSIPYDAGREMEIEDSKKTLLLVEDNPDMQAYLRETLVGEYRVIQANDGQDGVDLALEAIPDIIISDVMMPRLDGIELVGILKRDERTSHIPVILLTSKADVESRLIGLERGADEYLAKPFNREELLIRARNLLEIRHRLMQRFASLVPPAPTEEKDVLIEDAFLQKIRAIIEEHLSAEDFEIDGLARLVGMSRSQLFRKVKALTGQSPSVFIRLIRLQRAKELLESSEMNVSEVAYAVGFSTPTYFSDAFMETYGIRPSQLKK